MQQVEQYLDGGERDYMLIKGTTGPLVYPAAHVYIYSGLYRLTDRGKDVRKAQIIFAGLYLAVLSLVMACYRRAKVGPFSFSIYLCSYKRRGGVGVWFKFVCWDCAYYVYVLRHHSTYSLFW